jgi:enoyl-CoA hydratase/carnithine racemase
VPGEDRELVLYEVAEKVATITFNNPEGRNGWSLPMERAYFAQLRRAEKDPSVAIVVVTGAGRTFCPGLDMKALQAVPGSGGLNRTGRDPMLLALSLQKPMIAAINGACAGLGLLQALCCDLRFAAEGARLATAYSRRGLPAEYGMAWLMTRIMRLDHALDLLLSGRTVEAQEAATLGLVTRVYPPEQLLDAATAYAGEVAANCSPRALAAIRHQSYADLSRDLDTAMAETLELMPWYNSAANPDFREGVDSFVARRPPAFEPLPPDFRVSALGAPQDG